MDNVANLKRKTETKISIESAINHYTTIKQNNMLMK